MVNYAARINVGQGFAGETATLFFLVDPGGECLFHDPILRSLKALSHQIHFFGELHRNVGRDGSGFCGGCHDGLLLNIASWGREIAGAANKVTALWRLRQERWIEGFLPAANC
jgi:hypothetical protein